METSMMPTADEREYISMLNTMRQLGVTSLNLDAKNLKAYPSTRKLWHQLQAYPQEIIPLMDQTVKDVMVELATKEMERLRAQSFRHHAHANNPSSTPVNPSSDAMSDAGRIPQQAEIPDLVAEVETKNFKVLPFGLDQSVNMRDLDPAGQLCPQSPTDVSQAELTLITDMDKLVSIKGLVIRTTPIIPDMKEGSYDLEL